MTNKKEECKSCVEDMFDGKVLSCWKDEEYVYISFPWCVVNLPLENWKEVQEDFKQLVKVK